MAIGAPMTREQFQQTYGKDPYAPIHAAMAQSQAQPKSLIDKVGDTAQGISNFVGAKGLTDLAGSQLAKLGLAATGNMKAANKVEEPTFKQVAGSAIQTGANFIPGAGEGVGLLGKVALGAGTGYAMDVGSKLQNNEASPMTPGIATVVGGGLPVAASVAKPGVAFLGRLLKGIGSGLSGVPAHQLEQIYNNPEAAQQASQQIAKAGKSKLLEDNARTIVNGVSTVRQEAHKAFGEGVGALKAEDINPQTFRQSIQPILDKYGSELNPKTNVRTLNNVEFSDPKNITKAGNLIDKLAKTDLNGLSLRNLMNEIDNAKYKTTGSDVERLSFNAFLKDLSGGVKDAVTGSTDKLNEINQKYSQDIGLADAVQGIFGKVKFKNLGEVNKASQKLETLFAQRGLSPEITNDFLKRIGVNPEGFKASEAVRQLVGKEGGANSVGLGGNEVLRAMTSSIVTPEMVGAISAKTGATKEAIQPFLESLSLPTRNAVLQALLQAQGSNQSQGSQGVSNQ